MRIKTKLILGMGLLFVMLLVLTIVGAVYTATLKEDTQNILQANYNTIEFSRNMLLALDEIPGEPGSFQKFEENLLKQVNNITEAGEQQATEQLQLHYASLQNGVKDSTLLQQIRKDISGIMLLNMEAIKRKSEKAKDTATDANTWIVLTGSLCFLIGLTLLINLPGSIADPIKELSESIRQIAAKNYSQRIYLQPHNEFGELARSFNTMAEKLEEYDSSNLSNLLFEKKRVETLINNMHDPVIGLDQQKKILFVNDEAIQVIGIKREELVGKTAQDVAVTNDLIRNLAKELMLSAEEQSLQKTPVKIYADKKENYFEKEIVNITIIPTGEKEKKHIGYFIVLKNITPFKELDFAKTNFIATISHELKTPIASIKMSLQLLQQQQTGTVNDEQQQLMESIQDDSNRLLKITGELLNLSQVETGNIQLSLQQSDPHEIIHYALESVKVQAGQKQVTLHFTTADTALPAVKADAEKTAWVLVNLLTNAIRYSPEQSEVIISVNKLNDSILFSVKDVGKGIDTRYLSKIFDRYFQVPGSSRTGTGLGLAISKEFIEAQGGTIGVTSEIGMGSEFYFTLPVA